LATNLATFLGWTFLGSAATGAFLKRPSLSPPGVAGPRVGAAPHDSDDGPDAGEGCRLSMKRGAKG
jgi:hypothetical protein